MSAILHMLGNNSLKLITTNTTALLPPAQIIELILIYAYSLIEQGEVITDMVFSSNSP